MKLYINTNKFKNKKFRMDNRDFTSECVPISDTMEIKMHIRKISKELKYRIKHIFK